jgi:hypothetical protein
VEATLDPTSVHLMFEAPGFDTPNYGVVVDLAAPTRECVYTEVNSKDTTLFFVHPDGHLSRAAFDDRGKRAQTVATIPASAPARARARTPRCTGTSSHAEALRARDGRGT